MEYSALQVILVFIVTFIAAIDQFSFLESLYQPIVTGMVIGLILGAASSLATCRPASSLVARTSS